MMRDHPRRETLAEVQRLLARARPEQLRRLLDDIAAAEKFDERAEDTPKRRMA